ncbi:MAG: response regulator [Eubacterium sp.]|nr:response regulator [Eubacterium sp.]
MRYIKTALAIIVIMVFGYIILGEIHFPANVPENGNICETLSGEWFEVHDDGTRTPIEVPGRTDSAITIETKLPEHLDKDVSAMWFRGMDMKIWVGGELREDYHVDDYALLGDRSAECYVLASLYPEDAGKTLRVWYEYNSGMLYEVYYGTRIGILNHLFKDYGPELLVGLAILLLGLISFIASVVYRIIRKKYLEMQYLSLGVIIGAVWVMSNSIYRQIYTRNISVMSDMPFLMVIIMPLPFIVFINDLQKNRYRKLLIAAGILEIIDFILCTSLFISGKLSLVKSFPIAAGCAAVCVVIIGTTIILDIKNHFVRSYLFVAIAFAFLAVAALTQIIMYQFAHNGVFSGLFMAIGLFGFLLFSIIHTIKQLISYRVEANRAIRASETKSNFLANMSHEIRTPMNAILGLNEMILRESRDNEKISGYATDIKSAGNLLLSIINDILDLNKIEAGKAELIKTDFRIGSVFNDILNITRGKADDKGLEYIFNADPNLPIEFYGDEIRVRQIMLNVINNAIKYTEKGSVKIDVKRFGYGAPYPDDGTLGGTNESSSTQHTSRWHADDDPDEGKCLLIVTVSDTGMGIREEDLPYLFESFSRLEETKNRNIEGTGLGLGIAKSYIEMMGGSIDVTSIYGEGSTFKLYFPLVIRDATPIGDLGKAIRELNHEKSDYVPIVMAPDARVLVVDDNEMNLEVIEGLMEGTRIRVETAMSGSECIDKMGQKRYDLILMDQMMPGMDGIETLHAIRDKYDMRGVSVLALTADAIAGAKEYYLKNGFDDYLSKPVKAEELEHALAKYLPKQLLLSDADIQRIEKAERQNRIEKERLRHIVVVDSDPENLRTLKDELNGFYDGTYVTDLEKAAKYLSKHDDEYILVSRKLIETKGVFPHAN